MNLTKVPLFKTFNFFIFCCFVQELNSGHIAQLSQSFKYFAEVVEAEDSTPEQLFNLDLHLIIPFRFSLVFAWSQNSIIYTNM